MNVPRAAVAALAVIIVSMLTTHSARTDHETTRGAVTPTQDDDVPLRPTAPDPPGAVRPGFILGNASDVRALAASDGFAWAATSGGLDRYALPSLAHRRFGVADGLDTLDVRAVVVKGDRVLVETASSHCALHGERFACKASRPPAPAAPRDDTFAGAPVTARLATAAGELVGTRGAGLFLARPNEKPIALGETSQAPRSFVRKVVFYKDRAFVATFDDGLLSLDASGGGLAAHPELLASAKPTQAPARMINDVATDGRTLWVAANEGLFFSRDGSKFERVDGIEPRGVTSLATDGARLYATNNAALWRLDARNTTRRPRIEASWWRPAGTRSLQAVAISAGAIYLASEDRGVIAFDGRGSFTAFDKLSGLPTSWVLALAGDGHGGVFAATLRDGVLHVGAGGAWSRLAGLPSDWTLDVESDGAGVCVGTQAGAACYDDAAKPPSRVLLGLPDARVHVVQRVGERLFTGTEAGVALL